MVPPGGLRQTVSLEKQMSVKVRHAVYTGFSVFRFGTLSTLFTIISVVVFKTSKSKTRTFKKKSNK